MKQDSIESGEDVRLKQRFKVGDLVELKSGGPKMTVIEVVETDSTTPEPKVRTTWFAKKKNESAIFPTEALIAATTEPTMVERAARIFWMCPPWSSLASIFWDSNQEVAGRET